MAKKYAKKFYNSKQWKDTRASYIAHRQSVDGAMCEYCHDVPGYILDHVIEITQNNMDNPEITLSFNNFKYSCLNCHNTKTFGTLSKYKFNSDGEIIPID